MLEVAQKCTDNPSTYKCLGEVLGALIYDGTLSLNKVKDTLKPLVELNKAGDVLAEALAVAVEMAGAEEPVFQLWCNSNVTWDMVLSQEENVPEFLKKKRVEFTLKRLAPRPEESYQEEMKRILKDEFNPNYKIFQLIKEKVSGEEQSSPVFIRNITKVVCSSVMQDDTEDIRRYIARQCFDRDLFTMRSVIITYYTHGNNELELHVLYGLQKLVTDLKHPRGMLQDFVKDLKDLNVITKETFYTYCRLSRSGVSNYCNRFDLDGLKHN